MYSILAEKLRAYIVHNSPDLLVSLQADYSLTQYLEDKVVSVTALLEQLIADGKPPYIIEELCLLEMTSSLRPSKYQYLKNVLEEEFPNDYTRMVEAGVLTYEIINLIEICKETFETIGFTEENEEDRFPRYAVIADIHNYLN